VTVADTAVLDASVLVRSLTAPTGTASAWVARVCDDLVDGHTSEFAFLEVANALLGYVRAGALTPADATGAVEVLLALPLTLHGAALAPAALSAAIDLELSAYDAAYAALAEALDAVLVTADRRLAAAVPRAALVF
jgi:predicted nucleic acid-binding protein